MGRRAGYWQRERATLLASGAAVLASVGARIPQLGVPLMIDLPVYALIGARMGHGALPYEDLFDNKQPLIYGIFWMIDLVAPRSAFAIRLAAALVAGLTSLAMFFLLRSIIGRGRALLASVLTGILGASFVVEGLELNTEHLLAFTGTVAVLFSLTYGRRGALSVAFIAGVLGGFAILTKAVAALILPVALLPLVWHAWGDAPRITRRSVTYAGGVLLPLAATALIFLSFGALDDFWYANVTYNFRYIDLAAAQPLTALFRFPGELQMLVVAAIGVGVWRLVSMRARDLLSWSCLLWIIGSLVAAKQGRREFAHYYAILIPAAVTLLCAPLTSATHGSFWRAYTARRSFVAVSGALIIAGISPLFLDVARTFTRSPLENGRALWGSPVDFTDRQTKVGSWIAEHAEPDDELFVEGSWPAVYWAAGLAPATPYMYDFYVPQIEPDFYSRISAGLAADPPEWVVLFGDAELPDHIVGLQPRFEIAQTFEDIFVLRLKGAGGSVGVSHLP